MDIVLLILIFCLAGLLQGITGFGFALIASPLAFSILDKESVIISFAIIGLVLNFFLSIKVKAKINKGLVIYLTIFSLIGILIGIYILEIINLNWLKIIVGLIAIFFTLLFYFFNISLPQNKIITAITGFISGVLHTTTGLSGPPIVLLLTGSKMDKNEFRKNLVVFFFLSSLIALVLFWLKEMITWERTATGLIASPFVLLFANIGNKIVAKTSLKMFKLLTLGMVFFSGAWCLISCLK